jgi:hypothetical protein
LEKIIFLTESGTKKLGTASVLSSDEGIEYLPFYVKVRDSLFDKVYLLAPADIQEIV